MDPTAPSAGRQRQAAEEKPGLRDRTAHPELQTAKRLSGVGTDNLQAKPSAPKGRKEAQQVTPQGRPKGRRTGGGGEDSVHLVLGRGRAGSGRTHLHDTALRLGRGPLR